MIVAAVFLVGALEIFAAPALPRQPANSNAASQDSTSKQAAGRSSQTPQAAQGQQGAAPNNSEGPGAALDFLGSYSAPQAVLATETGHTSARPPSATTDQRLSELASDLGKVPVAPVELRNWLAGMLAVSDHSPEDWFRIGMAALQAARADSKRLTEIAPASAWNQRLEADALAGRYPALARSVWNGKVQESGHRAEEQTRYAGQPAIPPADAAAELRKIDQVPESPENLYRRARLLLGVSDQAFVRVAASPQLDARLYALQALAAEDENDEGGALLEYQTGLKKYPESALLNAGLGHLYRERNDLETARGQLDRAWRLDPTDPLVAFDLGDVELRTGQPAEAIAMLNRALGLDPNLLVARWARGRAYLAAGGEGSDQRALDDLTAAESCDTTGVLELQIAQVDEKLGRRDEAREHRQKSEEQRLSREQAKHAAAVEAN